MNDDDAEKILSILKNGGNLYLHPDDYADFAAMLARGEAGNLLGKVFQNVFIQKGKMIAAKPLINA